MSTNKQHSLSKCAGLQNVADALTKSLPRSQMRLLVGVTVRNSRSSAPFRRPHGQRLKGISIRNNNEGEQSIAQLSPLSRRRHPRMLHSNLASSNPYDDFLLHSTKVFGPRNKASRSPLLQTAHVPELFSCLPEPSSCIEIETPFPINNRHGRSRSFCLEFVVGV